MKKPLFYNNIVALNTETHRNLKLSKPSKPLEFARQANLIPALVDEFASSKGELVIAFLPGAEAPTPVFVAGLHPGSNVFISEEGLWTGSYAPAYLRRYPFILADVPESDPILCIDDTYEGLGEEEGARFFDDEGNSEEPLLTALQLAQSYRGAADRTEVFARMLTEMQLLTSVSLDSTTADGEKTSLHGLMVVDEDALSSLSGEQLEQLNAQGFLKPIYTHILSLGALSKLIVGRGKPPADDAELAQAVNG
jgi:hypothetical protein